jgi:hypothetical protein
MFDDDLIEKDITRLQEKYDENGYDCSMIIKLQRIEDRVDSTLLTYSNELKDLKKSILDLKENLETTCQSMDLISDSDILQPYGSVIGSLTKILKL